MLQLCTQTDNPLQVTLQRVSFPDDTSTHHLAQWFYDYDQSIKIVHKGVKAIPVYDNKDDN